VRASQLQILRLRAERASDSNFITPSSLVLKTTLQHGGSWKPAVLILGTTYADDAALGSVMRHLPDFTGIRRKRLRDRGGKAKIHDKHFGAMEANVDGLVEAINRKDDCLRV
jgi:hypothetical protein